jgi:hypothetical protein
MPSSDENKLFSLGILIKPFKMQLQVADQIVIQASSSR